MEEGVVKDEEIESFLSALRAADVDKKVNLIQLWGLKLEKASQLSGRAIDGITLSMGPLVRSSSQLLVASTLSSFLPFFIPLLPTTPSQSHLGLAITNLLPGLVEKLNDPKERVHAPAREAVRLLGIKVFQSVSQSDALPSKGRDKDNLVVQWESVVKDALESRAVRCKLECLKLLVQLRLESDVKLPLRPWMPALVNLLEDGDGAVRDQARETVVALLSPPTTPVAARTELKKLMAARNVRKSIVDGILARVLGGSNGVAAVTTRSTNAGAAAIETSPAEDSVEIVYVTGARDLEDEFRAMGAHFIGKETEHNWVLREQSLLRIRGVLRGAGFEAQPEAFLQGLKTVVVDGVCKTLLSLRTTLAQQSCIVVQELAEHLGPALDPFADQLLGTLGKMAGLTKRIIAERSQNAVTAIIRRTTSNPRALLGHIQAAVQDKSVQARQYGIAHLKTFLGTQTGQALATHDPAHALEIVDQLLRRALADTNAQVREKARSTFWAFEGIDQRSATAIIASLDGAAKKQLERSNPQLATEAIVTSSGHSAKPRAASSMSAMIAAKRAKAAAERAEVDAAPQCHFAVQPVQDIQAAGNSFPNPTTLADGSLKYTNGQDDASPHGPRPPTGDSLLSAGPRRPTDSVAGSPTSLTLSCHRTPLKDTESPESQRDAFDVQTPSGRHDGLHMSAERTPARDLESQRASSEGLYQGPSYATPQTLKSSELRRPSPAIFVDPAEEARRAQAAQGLSAARQLLEFDDDQVFVPTAPITPVRKLNSSAAASKTPLNMAEAQPHWKDSPVPMTPKLIQTLESRGYERSWWNTRRKLLEHTPAPSQELQPSDIVSDLKSSEWPNVAALQRIARFSARNAVLSDGLEPGRGVWEQSDLFDNMLERLLAVLDPNQPTAILEHALVAVWQLLQNQWPLFEMHEEQLLDHLFQLRVSRNVTAVESTNAMVSLLATVCDPPFLLLLLRSALERFLQGHTDTSHRTAGYNLALNTMGMCILRLPQEAVELEAGRISHQVVDSLDHNLGVASRQAGNRVILAVQRMLLDDNRTLAAFPQLSAGQRDFVTYQMAQAGLLGGAWEEGVSLDALHHDLVDGLAKGSRVR